METRQATKRDSAFLGEMALRFGHLPESALSDWLDPDWDFGWIGLDDDDNPVGASWWRAFKAVTYDGLNPAIREVYLGVDQAHEGRGFGSDLLNRLIETAREDRSIERLVARVVRDPDREQRIRDMLARRGFTENHDFFAHVGGLHVLEVAADSSQR